MEQYYSTLHNLKHANENHLKVFYLISFYLFLYSHLAYVQGVERDFLTFNADSTLQQSLSCNESRCCSWIENFLTFNTANGSSFGDISIGSNELFPSIKLNNDTISLKFINGAGIAFGYHQPISSRIFGRGKTRQGISGDKLFRSSLNSSYSQPTNGPSENLTGQQNNGQLPVQSEAYSGNSFVINPLITTQINNSRLNTIYHRKASNGGLDLLPTSKEFAIRVYNHLHNRPLIAIGNTRTGGIRWLTNTTVFGFRGVRLNVQNSANKAHYVGNVVSIVKVGLPCGHNYIRFGQRFFGDSNKIGIPTPLESVVTQPEVQGLKESS